MSVYRSARRAATARLQAMAHVPPIAFEGVPFSPPARTPWLRTQLLPLAPDRPRASDTTLHRCQFRVEAFTPIGSAEALDVLADAVRDAFPGGLALVADGEAWTVTATARSAARPTPDGWLTCLVTIALLTLTETP